MTKGEHFDVIVVGGRCAGSATAMLLARAGRRVLILDREDLPTDMKASTHMIWHSGVASLARWGLLERLKGTGCPAMTSFTLDLGGLVLKGVAPPTVDGVSEAYAPRRKVLDTLLLNAAREAGAEFRGQCTLEALLVENERVVGVRCVGPDGTESEVEATIVVGADGRHSKVARLLDLPVQDEHPRLQGTVWAYFKNLPIDDIEFYGRGTHMVYSWRTHENETVAGICFRYEEYLEVARNADDRMMAEFETLAPEFADRVAAAERRTPWMAGATRGFRRQASGSGWALVGDAGLTMDPITAAGITNSFRDAQTLADAIHDGLTEQQAMEDALKEFQARRDEASVPIFEFTRAMAALDPPDENTAALFMALAGNQEATNAYFGVVAQTVPVGEFFAPENVGRIIAAAQPG